ncbi:type II toxin-antitoxin system RelE/ParE family toxin [Glaciimonas sp. PAMC28666]|nr:type II toxin-antitoxin system RelE/ParE family toxin [Glaciimonas sp. PAMC28666]
MLHSSVKKTQKTPLKVKRIAENRMKEFKNGI